MIHHELVAAANAAIESNLGLHTKDASAKAAAVRKCNWSPSEAEVKAIFAQYKDKPVSSIIEFVRDGSSFRIYVPAVATYLNFSLAGVVAPRINNSPGKAAAGADSAAEGGDDDAAATAKAGRVASHTAEPYALQSRHFSELRLLGREIDVVFESLDPTSKTGLILGSIIHPRGNIAVELVRNGLARIADRNLSSIKK